MKKRMVWIDVLRIIGMIGVIVIHISGNTVNTLGLTGINRLIFEIIAKSFYFVLPLFVMISGMLLLNKDISFKDIWFKYIKRILLVILLFGGFFAFLEEFFVIKKINLTMGSSIIKRIFTGDLWAHMWYLYLVIALYSITPMLRKWIKNTTKKEQQYLLLILYIFTVLKVEICNFIGVQTAFYIPISTGFVFVYLLGHYLYINDFSKKERLLLYSFGGLSFLTIILLSYFNICDSLVAYTSSLCITVAASIFTLFKNKKITNNELISNFIITLGECSFGVYIIHQFFINIIYKVIHMDFILKMPYLGMVLYILIILTLSFFTVFILRKIKLVKKYIL